MGTNSYSKTLWASSALMLTLTSTTASFAGGFAIREQSAYYQGMSFAGAAAGDDLSSMFWNPAATAAMPGLNVESVGTAVLPNTTIKATGGTLAAGGANPNSGNIGVDAFVPASYSNYQVSDKLYLGLAMNSPFGFITKPDNRNWAGGPLGVTSKIFTFDLNPTVAYKVAPDLTIGVGAQIEYLNVRLNSGPYAPLGIAGRELSGHDWTVGGTAGVLWQPTKSTSLGLGYRSAVNIDTDVSCQGNSFTTFQAQGGSIPSSLAKCNAAGSQSHTNFTLPETVTFSLRQDLNERISLLGTVQFTKHSRIQTIFVNNNATGRTVDELPLNLKDEWFYSIGAEYKYNPALTLRTGVAYEHAPITDANRLVILPDTDRVWASVGATYKWSNKLSFDVGYSHLFFQDDAKIQSASLLSAVSNSAVDIVSASVKYRLGAPRQELEPYK